MKVVTNSLAKLNRACVNGKSSKSIKSKSFHNVSLNKNQTTKVKGGTIAADVQGF